MVAGGEIAKVLSETAEGMQKAGLEKPGAGFDGPWNQAGSDLGQETGKISEGQPGSGFDGAWNRVDQEKDIVSFNDEITIKDTVKPALENVDRPVYARENTDKYDQSYSSEITEKISSPEENKIYQDAGLQEKSVDGRPSLVRSDIDPAHVDGKGRTNLERMQQGLAPYGDDGYPLELHHIGQERDSPLAELTYTEHRKNGNSSVLHIKDESDVHRGNSSWDQEKGNHWKARAHDFE